jgi:ABC-type multidrug transport system fused ATPase/permease subunit
MKKGIQNALEATESLIALVKEGVWLQLIPWVGLLITLFVLFGMKTLPLVGILISSGIATFALQRREILVKEQQKEGLEKQKQLFQESLEGLIQSQSSTAENFLLRRYEEKNQDFIKNSWDESVLKGLTLLSSFVHFLLGFFWINANETVPIELALLTWGCLFLVNVKFINWGVEVGNAFRKSVDFFRWIDAMEQNFYLPKNASIQKETQVAALKINGLRIRSLGKELGNFSFQLKPGTLALVTGPSHSGKTDLIQVLNGEKHALYGQMQLEDEKGKTVWFSGWDNPRLPLGLCGSVDKTPYFFEGTLRENLTFACETRVTEVEIWDALEALGLEGLVQSLGGLNAKVQRGAINIPRPERYRLGVCRWLLLDKPFMLLDEPFVYQDKRGVELLWKAIRKKSEHSSVVVASRLVPDSTSFDLVIDIGNDSPRLTSEPILAT